MPLPIPPDSAPRPPRSSPRLRRLGQVLSLATLLAPLGASADDKAAPAKSGNSVSDGFRSLGQQISDPKTLDRIKGHEQDFEKNVQGTRDQQRKNHPGELRASDATDMAKDPRMGGKGAGSDASKTAAKPKAGPAKAKTVEKPSAAATTDSKSASAAKAPPPAATAPAK